MTRLASTPSPIPYSSTALLPPEMQRVAIGTGNVQSQIDRSIRIAIEGTGPASTRALRADSAAAHALMSSPHGATLERGVRAMLAAVDGTAGRDNIRTLTLVPDEHASKGVYMLNYAAQLADHGSRFHDLIEPSDEAVAKVIEEAPWLSEDDVRTNIRTLGAQQGVAQITDGHESDIRFSAGWNGGGHLMIMPDVSRRLLGSLGLYASKPGDPRHGVDAKHHPAIIREDWDTAIHELHHSITPLPQRKNPEWTRVMEEAISVVLTPSALQRAQRAGGALRTLPASPDAPSDAGAAGNAGTASAVDWDSWNRAHLPAPPPEEVATAKGRYVNGPNLVRQLLRMADIDRRTTAGQAAALELLQGADASRVPRRLAGAIAEAHGLPSDQIETLAQKIRDASIGRAEMADITRLVERRG